MKIRLYSVLDRTAQQFGAPMSFHNDDVARRSFADAFLDPESVFALHPDDFELHFIGEFESVDRSFVSEYTPEPVMNGTSAAHMARQIIASMEPKPEIPELN
jgi:hypothetical protein